MSQNNDLATILLALEELGLAMPLQESLESSGHAVVWDSSQADSPNPENFQGDLVIVSAGSKLLSKQVAQWRYVDPPLAIVAFGSTQTEKNAALKESVPFVDATFDQKSIEVVIHQAISSRFGAALSMGHARGALKLGPKSNNSLADACRILAQSKTVDIATVSQSLDPYAQHYLTATELIAPLREERALSVPQLELVRNMDGAHTVRTIIRCGVVPKAEAARHLWAITSIGAATLTPSPPDASTTARRAVIMAQNHLATRHARLEKSTLYDVLEVLPSAPAQHIQLAVSQLRVRYSPNAMDQLDLAAYQPFVAPIWKQILYAHKILSDGVDRANYNDTLHTRIEGSEDAWAFETDQAPLAAESYARGHQALVAGELFKAVSAIATACRQHPDHPIYETGLCWARYRAEVSRGETPPHILARKEREIAEKVMLGRRPWPNALVALGMLCAADKDPMSARWYLSEALTCNPNLPAAQKLMERLSK